MPFIHEKDIPPATREYLSKETLISQSIGAVIIHGTVPFGQEDPTNPVRLDIYPL